MIFARCLSGTSEWEEDGEEADDTPDVTEAVDGL